MKLLEFVDHLQALKLASQVKAHLYKAVSRECRGADLLLLASDKDDWPMGRRAIQCLTPDNARQIQDREEVFEGFFERLRPEWRRTLIDLIFFASYQEAEVSTERTQFPRRISGTGHLCMRSLLSRKSRKRNERLSKFVHFKLMWCAHDISEESDA